jgi:hypothetical protein
MFNIKKEVFKMTKVYARQISPEFQESPLQWTDIYPDGVILDGNKRNTVHTIPAYDHIKSGFEDMTEYAEYCGKNGTYQTITDCISDYLPCEYKKKYSTNDIHEWKTLIKEYDDNAELTDNIICTALKLMTGKEYESACIRGCSQGDWQDMYYPIEYGKEFVQSFETEYFNTGSEWIIHDEEIKPEKPEDITGGAMYCYSYDPQKEIAEAEGVKPEDVVLYEFDHYRQVPVYKEVC